MPRLPDAPSFEVPRDYAQIDRDEDIYEETWEVFNVNSKDAVLQRIGEVVMDTTDNVRGGLFGLYSPGLHIPVLPSAVLADRRPDYLLILAWNFAEPIMRNNSDYAEKGGRFIVPIPEVKIVPDDKTIH